MTFEEKIDRYNNVAGLTKIVCEISASFGKPSPDHCWIEAAVEVAANQEADYAWLLLRAGGRYEKIISDPFEAKSDC